MSPPLLSISGLGLTLAARGGSIDLLSDVSFDVAEGEVVGLVGESGSGKSLTCRAVMRLLPPHIKVTSGRVDLDGENILPFSEQAMRTVRGRKIGMIFQNPSTYLDPVMTIGDQIAESLRTHEGLPRNEALEQAAELLHQVGIPDPVVRVHAYPHEFSGGMRQRAMIAAALACKPRLLIADEPTTALDVTIQAQILRLLLDLRDELGLSMILVTHDLSVVTQTCDKVVVLYAGRVMEIAPTNALLTEPLHPYSKGLIASQPELAAPGTALPSIPGQPPGPFDRLDGCRFAPRCTFVRDRCSELPALHEIRPGRSSSCHFWSELAAS